MKRSGSEEVERLTAAGRISRRELLRLALASAGALVFPGSLSGSEPPGWLSALPIVQGSDAGGLPVTGPPITIDPHTHIFNARDVAVAGFLRNVNLLSDQNVFVKLYVAILFAMIPNKYEDALTVFVEVLAKRSAPTIQEEKQRLAKLCPDPATPLTPEQRKRFWERVACENRELDSDIRQIVENSLSARLQKEFEKDKEAREEKEAVVRFVTRTMAMRYQNAGRLMETYQDSSGGEEGAAGKPGISIFTPSLVDMALWLGDESSLPMDENIEVMSKIARLSNGQILPFISFDPWRQAFGADGGADRGKPLEWVKQAVLQHGFVGVKLYPPMGFRPIGNVSEKKWPKSLRTWKGLSRPDRWNFGSKLDEALGELYEWCEKNSVPLMVHGNNTMGAGRRYAKRGGPKKWGRVLEKHENLRLNFGHFGGWNGVEKANSWTREIARLMQCFDHVYADVGDFNKIGDEKDQRKLARGLAKLIAKFPRVEDRVLYASDWFMGSSPSYLSDFRQALKRPGLESLQDKFFGLNAANFLGLYRCEHNGHAPAQCNVTRTRLDRFYRKHGIEPAWRARLDGQQPEAVQDDATAELVLGGF